MRLAQLPVSIGSTADVRCFLGWLLLIPESKAVVANKGRRSGIYVQFRIKRRYHVAPLEATLPSLAT